MPPKPDVALPTPASLGALKISSRQITLLNALGEFGNLRRAAAAMHTTQPAASLLLQQLEERLGVRLFERLPRGMQPTLYGEVMIRYAQGALHEFEHAQAQIAELARGASGLVRVGSVMGPVPGLLTQAVLAYKREHPKVRISLEVGTSDTLLPSLLRGDFDLVVGRLPDQSDSHELNIELFDSDEQMRVVARAGHPLASAARLALADLAELTWILHPIGSPMRRRVENALQAAGMVQSLDIVETASILATTAMLEASDMIAVVPNDVAEHYARYAMVAILPVELPISMVNLGLLTLRSRPRSVALETLLHYLRAQ
ncbi:MULTISPECIES: LysR substrate-binding domain-containing protein [Pseudomonas]|uniref:LysR family transcriptional regulator n=1 Tax=Pseudomonas vranovensis TaxID=321661 RepID=A0A423DGW4_9PSED|nr:MULTISPECIES: LysR substrate-binding domain-containing protein [Pseudomonas]ROL70779.1 LysR family transcriptional regulator [Pseudomonas vranovensis]UVL58796.1 LysR substrate-binding domain-containing protein [Pseudomonas sp. B21-035]SDQ71972.1 transcriptional regulator, LysR family [Pseudomonas sp. UC 17F4]